MCVSNHQHPFFLFLPLPLLSPFRPSFPSFLPASLIPSVLSSFVSSPHLYSSSLFFLVLPPFHQQSLSPYLEIFLRLNFPLLSSLLHRLFRPCFSLPSLCAQPSSLHPALPHLSPPHLSIRTCPYLTCTPSLNS